MQLEVRGAKGHCGHLGIADWSSFWKQTLVNSGPSCGGGEKHESPNCFQRLHHRGLRKSWGGRFHLLLSLKDLYRTLCNERSRSTPLFSLMWREVLHQNLGSRHQHRPLACLVIYTFRLLSLGVPSIGTIIPHSKKRKNNKTTLCILLVPPYMDRTNLPFFRLD